VKTRQAALAIGQLSLFDDEAPAAAPAYLHPQAQREAVLDGGSRVGYRLRRVRRRSIGFVVDAEGLTISAPRWVGLGEIDAALREKSRWVLAKLAEQHERQRRLQASRIAWRDGARFPFLGATVILALDAAAPATMLDEQGRLHLPLPHDAGPERIREAVQGWLQRQARRVFDERCRVYAERLGVRVTRLALSSAATRWGSASADGAIRLHWRLIHFALPVVDYVVAHELAHLREMNHGPKFWDLVRSVVPDVDAARGALKDEALPVFEG
jgi:predicted metal-dependent hydrolase